MQSLLKPANRITPQKIQYLLNIFMTAVFMMSCAGGSGGTNNSANTNNYPIAPGAPESPLPFKDITAAEYVAGIKIGWNLGNTFDAVGDRNGFSWLGGGRYANTTVQQMETAWGNPVTAKENFIALKNAGFNAVRIPVSWSKSVDVENIIRADWMARIAEVVNYAADIGLYVILNTHHDEELFKFTNAQAEESLSVFKKIWEQIAAAFRNYDEKLIFEALNEPRTKGSPQEWTGGIIFEHLNLNKHYEVFVEAVRSSGGNNNKRVLMVNTYAASAEQIAMSALVIPADTVPDKIIASIHSYSPYDFALNLRSPVNTWSAGNSADTRPITDFIDRAYSIFVSKGIPVILGEFGAMNKENADIRAEWAEFYTGYAMGKGMPCFWWDNGVFTGGPNDEKFGLLDRRTNNLPYPQIVDGLMRGVSAWQPR